ncbi:hypothetical protein CRG98_040081 [Punica granatum]|uniref:Uncharacterized protein n=1 Tax=Punica granatum TaxID=22663 RepID=A0A2I0I6L4_PUNGR|nr:hypothetical protein CRG98_040081 [Punica granatum]
MEDLVQSDWQQSNEDYPGAAQFQNKVIPLIDQLEIIFGGTDDSECSEPPTQRRRLNDCSVTTVELTAEPEMAKETDGRNDAVESGSAVTAQRSAVIGLPME